MFTDEVADAGERAPAAVAGSEEEFAAWEGAETLAACCESALAPSRKRGSRGSAPKELMKRLTAATIDASNNEQTTMTETFGIFMGRRKKAEEESRIRRAAKLMTIRGNQGQSNQPLHNKYRDGVTKAES